MTAHKFKYFRAAALISSVHALLVDLREAVCQKKKKIAVNNAETIGEVN